MPQLCVVGSGKEGYKPALEERGHLAGVIGQDADGILGPAAEQAQHGVLLRWDKRGGTAIAVVCHSPTQGTARETRAGAGTRSSIAIRPGGDLVSSPRTSPTGSPEPIFQHLAAE